MKETGPLAQSYLRSVAEAQPPRRRRKSEFMNAREQTIRYTSALEPDASPKHLLASLRELLGTPITTLTKDELNSHCQRLALTTGLLILEHGVQDDMGRRLIVSKATDSTHYAELPTPDSQTTISGDQACTSLGTIMFTAIRRSMIRSDMEKNWWTHEGTVSMLCDKLPGKNGTSIDSYRPERIFYHHPQPAVVIYSDGTDPLIPYRSPRLKFTLARPAYAVGAINRIHHLISPLERALM